MTRKMRTRPALNAEIISSIEKPIPTKELLARLSKVADELSAVDQETAVLEEYKDIAKKLANPKLIKHANVGVQAYASCAIADIVRLYAPEAPFDEEELSNIFKAFFAQFSYLWDEESTYFLQQSYILKRLVEVRSIVLIGDLPDSQQLVSLLFGTMYNLATKRFPSKLESLASELLAEVISEVDHIPQDVVALIIKHLTLNSESKLLSASSNISNTAFVFSLTICEANSDKLARSIAQLFSEMLDDSAKFSNEKDHRGPFKALEKIHLSSVQIWAHVPDLLGSVMGLISDELNSDDEGIRLLATKTIGGMLSSSGRSNSGNSAVTFVSYHRDTWTNWLKKASDASHLVRSTWIEQLPDIFTLETTSEINHELSSGFTKCLSDSSEKVRFSTCSAFETLPFTVSLKKICSTRILNILFQLIRERHTETRSCAINILANLYNNCMNTIAKGDVVDLGAKNQSEYEEVLRSIVNDIPNNLLRLNYINDKAITTAVDIALFEKLLPFDDSAEIRVFRLCQFLKALDDKGKPAFVAITNRQTKNAQVILKYLSLAEEYASSSRLKNENTEVATDTRDLLEKMEKIAKWLESQFPDGLNSFDSISTFFKLKNSRYINLLKNCVDSDSEYKTVKNSAKELLTKLSDGKNIKQAKENGHITTADMVSNFKILLYRSSVIFYNKSNISALLKISQDKGSENQAFANDLMSMITTNSPSVCKNHVDTLMNMVKVPEDNETPVPLLRSLFHILRRLPERFPTDDTFFARIKLLAERGNNLQAKYCVKIVGCSPSKESLLSGLLDTVLPLSLESTNLRSNLSVVAETYLIDPLSLSGHSTEITAFIVEDVLKKNRMIDSEAEIFDRTSWIEEEQLELHPILVEKLVAIRLIANKLRYIASDEMIDAATLSATSKPINLLANIISNNGELVKLSTNPSAIATPKCYRLRLKLMAGLMLLKLAKHSRLNAFLDSDVLKKMSRLLFDEEIHVREVFLKALRKNLQMKKISERFLHLVFFMGHDPDSSLKSDSLTWIASQHRRLEASSDTLLERVSVRLIHAISHDDRFCKLIVGDSNLSPETELDAYKYASGFLSMFIDSIVKETNINMLYYLASRVKQYRDCSVESSLYNVESLSAEVLNLYRVTELFQLMLKELADVKGWNLQTWPGKINLPSDLFSPMHDYEQAHSFISRVYIPDPVQIKLREHLAIRPSNALKRGHQTSRKHLSVKRVKAATRTNSKNSSKKGTDSKVTGAEHYSAPSQTVRKSSRSAKKVFYGESDEETALNGVANDSENVSRNDDDMYD